MKKLKQVLVIVSSFAGTFALLTGITSCNCTAESGEPAKCYNCGYCGTTCVDGCNENCSRCWDNFEKVTDQ